MIGYVDAFSGCSGDMLLGALLDAGLPLNELRAALSRLPLGGYRIEVGPRPGDGPSGSQARVLLDEQTQPERRLADVRAVLQAGALDPDVAVAASRVFERLARVEASVHGISIDEVHFHEVGAADAIVDVVGVVWGLQRLGVQRLHASALPCGTGQVHTRHGTLPVPAPATLALLAEVNAPVRLLAVEAELVTPTGAALLAELATFTAPQLRLGRVGSGYGTRVLPWPNLLRLWLGQPVGPVANAEEIVIVETNVDDMTPEQLGYSMECLFAAGALDVTFTPIQMKKNRPGTQIAALAAPGQAGAVAEAMLAETSTLGVRLVPASRLVCERQVETVATRFGPIRVKVKQLGERRIPAPEYEDCAAAARRHCVPLAEVYRAVLVAAPG